MNGAVRLLGDALVIALLVVGVGEILARPAAGQGTPETPEGHHAAAMDHLRAGRSTEALNEFRAALRLNRNYLPSLVQMADLLSSSDHVFEAYGVLQHAAEIAPQSAEVHALLGRCLSRLERLKDARDELQRALELDPRLTEPHYGLAAVDRQLGRLADARRHVETFLERSPDEEAAKELRAGLCLEMMDYDAAVAAYRALAKAHPENRDFPREIARTLAAAGRYEEAEQAYRTLLDRDATDREALRGVYDASYKRGAYQESVSALERLAKLQPKSSCEPLLLLSRSYQRLGQLPEARQRAERCLELERGHSGAHFLIGWTWLGEGDLDKAKAEFEQALLGDPNSTEALFRLATVEARLGNRPGATRLLEKAVKVDPDFTSARYELAQAYTAERRPADAAKQFEEFRRLKGREAWKSAGGMGSGGASRPSPAGPADAGHLEDWIGFATYLIGEKKPREALAILEPARKAAPGNAEVMLLTAAAYVETGQIEPALAAYAEAEKHGPTGLLYWGRGTLYRRLREDALALADLRRALSLDLPAGKAAQAHLVVASIFSQERRGRETEAELRRSLAVDPTSTPARLLLAETLLQTGQPAEAAREAQRVLDHAPDDVTARLALAQACVEQKRYDDAAGEIARAARTDGESARVLLARGRLAAAQGNASSAVDLLTRVVQTDPSRSEVFHLLGEQLLEGRRVSDAAVAFEKATIVDPTDAASWLALGRIYLGAKRAPAAVNYFEKAVGAAPDDPEARYQLATALDQAGRAAEAEEAARQAKALGHPQADSLLQSLAARKAGR